MDYLIKIADATVVHQWSTAPGRVHIPNSGDVVFVRGVSLPVNIGEGYFLATATVIDEPIDEDHKVGAEQIVIDVIDRTVVVTNPAVPKEHTDRMKDWQREMRVFDQTMPRHFEEHIEHAHGGVADNIYQQAKYDAKKQLRTNKP